MKARLIELPSFEEAPATIVLTRTKTALKDARHLLMSAIALFRTLEDSVDFGLSELSDKVLDVAFPSGVSVPLEGKLFAEAEEVCC